MRLERASHPGGLFRFWLLLYAASAYRIKVIIAALLHRRQFAVQLPRITSYNVCYTKLLRCVTVDITITHWVTLATLKWRYFRITSYNVCYTKLLRP